MSLFLLLLRLQELGVVINEVFILPTNTPGEPDLTGVRVINVTFTAVIFEKVGSAGSEQITVPLQNIVAIDHTAIV